jgi:hypothetical protein
MILKIKVKTNANENSFVCLNEDIVIIKIKEKPVQGKANKELLKFLAKKLGISINKINILKGKTSQYKTLKLDTTSNIQEILEQLKN